MLLTALLITLLAPGAPASEPHDPSTAESAQLVLSGQTAHLLAEAVPPALVVVAQAHNRLTLPIRAVQIGVLFAETEEALRGADPSKLYIDGPPADGHVGVVNQRVRVTVPAQGGAPLSFRVAVPDNAPQPTIFLTHVLGYELAEADAASLLALLGTAAAADEVAACNTFALTGDAAAKAAARARFADNRQLVVDLAATAVAAAPPQPTQTETFRRVFALRALGVLGGATARDVLEKLLHPPAGTSSPLTAFDGPLQVLRVARLVGSPLETPLAFAVPPEAQRLTDVVAAALQDLAALDLLPTPPPEARSEATTIVPVTDPQAPRAPVDGSSSVAWWVVGVVGLAITGTAWRAWRRRAGGTAAK